MEDTRITFEVAKLAKEKGFYEFYFAEYYDTKGNEYMGFSSNPHDYDDKCIKSSQSLLAKWLREAHFTQSIFVSVEKYNYESPGSFYFIPKIDFQRGHKLIYTSFSKDFSKIWQIKAWEGKVKFTFDPNSYETALEAGLLKSLEICEEKFITT